MVLSVVVADVWSRTEWPYCGIATPSPKNICYLMWFCIMSGIYVRELGPDCGATLCMYVSISRDV